MTKRHAPAPTSPAKHAGTRRVAGGIVALVGFVLSPLSWWNDLVVNVPLALAFAWVVALAYPAAFAVAAVVGYWLTNVLGLVLLHRGTARALSGQPQPYGRRELMRDVRLSLLYTVLIVTLILLGVLQPLDAYFASPPAAPSP